MYSFIRSCLVDHIPNYLKRGRMYRSYLKFLKSSDDWDIETIKKYHDSNLKKIEAYVRSNVEFYKNKSELISHKSDIKNHFKQLFNDNGTPYYFGMTGGTTGRPIKFCISKAAVIKHEAMLDHILEKYGFSTSFFTRKIVFRGAPLPRNKSSIRFGFRLYLSSYHLNKSSLKNHCREIERFKAEIIHAFPSSIITLAKYIKNECFRVDFTTVRFILISSELCSVRDKELLKSVFCNALIIDFYSNSEQTVLGYQVDFEDGFFPFQMGGVTVDNDNNIYSTSYNEFVFPLINYKTDDRVSNLYYDDNFHLRYKSILGRAQSYLVGHNDMKISIASLNMHESYFCCVYGFQFEQLEPGVIQINLVVGDDFAMSSEDVKKYFYGKLSGFDIKFVLMDELKRTKSGKEKLLISSL